VPELEEPLPATVVDIIVNSAVHTTLETAVIAAGLADDLSGTGPFTVFAPTDAAFAALPAGLLDALLADPTGDLASVLLYHVVAGQALSTDLSNGQVIETLLGQDITITIDANGVFVNDAEVIIADLLAENGVVHVIDAVLVPELEEPLPATVVDIIVNSAVHTTLETAVIAAGLADDLSGTGPFTVFAPTDAAFAALPAGVLDALLADPTGALADVLLYHVVAGQALSTDLSNGQIIETLLGEDVVITINGDGVFVNDAQVIVADLLAENGVVHVIDMVLSPPVSVLETNKIAASVYPNPASEQLTIVLESSTDNAMYQIYDMRGAIVKQGMLNSVMNNLEIQDMASGPYQIRIVSNERSAVLPFIRK
jgi:uncharacterized surface protein with fasciclin (FAS1) repeats